MAKTPPTKKTIAALAGLLGWLIPGAGHWYIGRPARAIILFVTIQALFWSGVAVGGVFTVQPSLQSWWWRALNPREEDAWWWRAQVCTGLTGIIAYQRQASWYARVEADLPPQPRNPISGPPRDQAEAQQWQQYRTEWQRYQEQADANLAKSHLALTSPAGDIAYIFSGVAGMLNLMCIFDAVLLSLMGRYGEPRPEMPEERREAQV